jgi:short-subunit dehydrogenase
MSEKNVLITGCSSGIGLDAALKLKEKGFAVMPTARKPADVERLREQGFASAFLLDLQQPESVLAARDIIESTENLYALVNNAWSGLPGAQEDLSSEALRNQFEYVFGSIQLTHHCLPCLRRYPGKSRLIQVSSVLGFSVLPFRGAYAAAKTAWEVHSAALRMELSHVKGNNVTVSVIQPGPIVTAFRKNSRTAFNRLVTPGRIYEHCYGQLLRRLDSEAPSPGALPASAVTDAILQALEAGNPRHYYAVTTNTRLMGWIEKGLPSVWKDRLKRNMF